LFWIPPGFAHGFYVTSESAEFLYKCTDIYAPEHERCLRWDAPDLAIDWPLVGGEAPALSAKDQAGVALKDAEVFA
jgi:dTDP-4-dehydrorhamnose 3,5-epimerase